MGLQYNKGILEKGNLLMKQYTPEELNKLSKEEIVALLMQSQKETALFKERLEELQMHLFSRSTERMECLGQESMFNEAEAKYNEEENEPEIEKAVVLEIRYGAWCLLCPFTAGAEWRGGKPSFSKVAQSIPEFAAENESSKR